MVDHSDHVSMKNAAKCDNLREMQKPVNVEFSNSNGTHSYSVRMFFRLLDSYQTEMLQWLSAFSGWPNSLNILSCLSSQVHQLSASNRARLRAEFKHINKPRKRKKL